MEQEQSSGGKPKVGNLIKTENLTQRHIDFAKENLSRDPAFMQRRDDSGKLMEVSLVNAKENGDYYGRVMLNRDGNLIQAVGKDRATLVAHNKEHLELIGDRLKWLDENKRLNGQVVQIHYHGDQAKVYPYNPERAQARREERMAVDVKLKGYEETLNPKAKAALEKGAEQKAKPESTKAKAAPKKEKVQEADTLER